MKILVISGSDPKARERLLETLVAELDRQGIKVSVAVRMPEGFDMDRPGKDSFEHRRAGAHEVVLASSERWALMGERPPRDDQGLEALATRLSDVDLLIADGFESGGHPSLRILEAGEAPGRNRDTVAYALAAPHEGALDHPAFQLDDSGGIASFILARCGLSAGEERR